MRDKLKLAMDKKQPELAPPPALADSPAAAPPVPPPAEAWRYKRVELSKGRHFRLKIIGKRITRIELMSGDTVLSSFIRENKRG